MLEVYLINKVTLDGVAAEVTLDVGGSTISDARPMSLYNSWGSMQVSVESEAM